MNKKMRVRKEVQTIYKSEEISQELKRIYKEGICIDEYKKLLNEYKKLYKRYEKTIKVSDCIGNRVMKRNHLLNSNLEYTIKTARNNLFLNISEHRKTKGVLLNYKEKTCEYENVLNELLSKNRKIQKKLNNYEKQFGEIKHEFSYELDIDITRRKTTNFENISLEKILSLIFDKSEDNYILIKLKLKNFDEVITNAEKNSSVESFIEKTYAFLETNLNDDSILYYENKGAFYMVLVNEDLEDVELLRKKINSKRDIYNFEIAFNMAMSKYIKSEDSIDGIIKRCDIALKEAISKNKLIVC